MSATNPVACGCFLLLGFVLAGIAQTAWFASPASERFMQPVDGRLTFRGRRLFGENKTLRGFIVMVPAAAAAFALLAILSGDPASLGLWPLSIPGYLVLGAVAGLGFMSGELPNSFVKRQRGITPGQAARTPAAAAVHFAIDRVDSGIGMLVAVNLIVTVHWLTAVTVLTIGPFIHGTFSMLMFRLGVKARAA